MDKKSDILKYFSGFSKLSRDQRFQRLMEMGALKLSDIEYLRSGGVQELDLADNLIENALGYFQLPLGVATNFVINGKPYVIPMAVEETSIIAAASKTARWVQQKGQLTTTVEGTDIIGQIQIAEVHSFENLKKLLEEHRSQWIEWANTQVAASMVARGGGVSDIRLRQVSSVSKECSAEDSESGSMAVFHVHFNPCDAMGANMINQVCEGLKGPIEEASGETVTMCILSNLVDTKLTVATVEIDEVEEALGQRIEQASLFAESDPYRAATNNKGVLNGIDPILIATGNDWRAVESGLHAYCCQDGQYRSLTQWRYKDGRLTGVFRGPLIVGTVGGVTSLHPTARLCLELLGTDRASELSQICAAVGLVQNLGALRALTTVGIIEGHMKLHIKNLTLGTDASDSERQSLQKRLEQLLAARKKISLTDALQVLQRIRESKGRSHPQES